MIKGIKDFIHKDEKFLDEWANGDSGFVRDGVVNPETYFSDGLRYRILYLFKEVNDYYGDLREVLRDAKRKPTWNNVARWTEGILNLDKIFLWKDVQDIDDDYRKSALSKIASINLKKTSGYCVADENKIRDAAELNKKYLCQQINSYEPHMIICGGTGYFFSNSKWQQTSRGIKYIREPNDRIIVSYCHPEARIDNCIKYYALIDALREILDIHPFNKLRLL